MQPLIQQINDNVPFSVLLLLTDPISACFVFFTLWSHNVNRELVQGLWLLLMGVFFCPLYLNPHHLCIGVPFFLVPHHPVLNCLVLSRGNHFLTTILKYWSYYEARTQKGGLSQIYSQRFDFIVFHMWPDILFQQWRQKLALSSDQSIDQLEWNNIVMRILFSNFILL